MTDPIKMQFHKYDGEVIAVTLDIIDFHFICHQGTKNNKSVFKEILIQLDEMENDKENN